MSFFVSLVPASNLCVIHLFNGFFGASFHVINPVFFFDLCCVHFVVVFEGDVAVLIVVCV